MQIIDKIITDTDTHTLFGVGDLNMKSATKVKSIRITNTNSSTATTVRVFKYKTDKNPRNKRIKGYESTPEEIDIIHKDLAAKTTMTLTEDELEFYNNLQSLRFKSSQAVDLHLIIKIR
tara:strand:- start:58 stop:414 length:357 start_codon:yes stop_codon:yes gene_type:complete